MTVANRFPAMLAQGQVFWLQADQIDTSLPFYQQSLNQALFKKAQIEPTSVSQLINVEETIEKPPAGFIFQMSRCGSTLLSNALSNDEHNVVLREYMPLEAILFAELPIEQKTKLIQGLITSLNDYFGHSRRLYFKLSSLGIFHISLLKSVFPDVPSIFLFRNPLEVVASNIKKGIEQSWIWDTRINGMDSQTLAQSTWTETLVSCLERKMELALKNQQHLHFIHYPDICHPEGMTSALDYLGGIGDKDDMAQKIQVTLNKNAKHTRVKFQDDSLTKASLITEEIRSATEARLDHQYQELNQLATALRAK